MKKIDVVIALERLRTSRETWGKARTEFFAGYDVVLRRLLHEGTANYMSANDIASVLGVSPGKVRAKMRSIGLDTRLGKRALSDQAAKALVGNAELLGIKPWEMDLMSPLAYLPMGDKLKRELHDAATAGAIELEYGDSEQLAQKLTDAGLTIEDARRWVSEVIIDALTEAADDAEEFCRDAHSDQPPCTCFTVVKQLRNRIAALRAQA